MATPILPKSVLIVIGGIIGTAIGLIALSCALTYALGAELQATDSGYWLTGTEREPTKQTEKGGKQGKQEEVLPLLLSSQTPPSISPPSILTRQCLLTEMAEAEALHAIISHHLGQAPGTNAITKDFLQGQVDQFLSEAYRLQFGGGQQR